MVEHLNQICRGRKKEMHKVTKYPYMISFPDIDESQWTTWFIRSKDEEDELYKVLPEYFGQEPKNINKYRAKPKDVKMVEDYFKEVKIEDPESNAELFYAHYESVGWFRGKSKIKNWKMCLKNWDFKNKDDVQAEQVSKITMFKLECLECGFASKTERKDTRMVCRRCEHKPLMTVTNIIK